jgi:hypothetical protein
MARFGFTIFCLLMLAITSMAQESSAGDDPRNHPYYVFIQPDTDGGQTLIFVDGLTGTETTLNVTGERFTLFGRSVLFFDTLSQEVMIATPEGTLEPHPFMQKGENALRIDWVAARDGKLLAWTETHSATPGELTTTTHIAAADGSDERELLSDTRRDGLRVMPVAFDHTQTRLYLDYQPDGLGGLTAYPQYAGLFEIDLQSGKWQFLEGEPGDFTGAGFGGEFFLRLALKNDLSGFDLNVYNLDTKFSNTIPALSLRGTFTQGGDILISPDGNRAIYALSQINQFGTPQQNVRTVFVLVDLAAMTQQSLTEITTFVRPVAWTEDNSAVIFTSPQQTGTWKISLGEARLEKIAEPTYLGILS